VNVLIVLGLLAVGAAAVVEFLEGSYLRGFQYASFGLPFGVYIAFLIAGRDSQEELAKHPWIGVIYTSLFASSAVAAVVMMIRENEVGRLGLIIVWALGVATVMYQYKKRESARRAAAAQAPPLAG
jgi:hypothetical protein